MRITFFSIALAALVVAACSKDGGSEPTSGALAPTAAHADSARATPSSVSPADGAAQPGGGAAPTPTAKPAVTPTPPVTAKPVVTPKPPVTAKPTATPKPTAPATPKPVAATAPSPKPLSLDELRELERRPGATPALDGHDVAAPAPREGFPGKPGTLPAHGPDDALVKVYVFSDFQCPVCRRAAEPVKLLAREFPDDVQIIFVHNALPMHAHAEPAARAAIAAQLQGKFWEYYDALFADARHLGDADLEQRARNLGLDVDRFLADWASPAVAERVVFLRALAEALGVRGTPGFFVNGHKTVGWGSYMGLRSQVARAVKEAKRLVEAGTPRAEVAQRATAAAGEDGARFAELFWGTTP